ncbi:MAG: hypothetical protein HY820_08140 [Acidobacteria bacterium]|nr:hypothetical protein [Acidobacteriota bacterium]
MATKKTTPKKAAAGKKNPSLRVRMYRQGLGDCFLLTFPGKSGKPFYMMIDCGVVLGTAQPEGIMKSVVNDIIRETNGHIDVLVATHEHWDHISGFVQAKDLLLDKTKLQVDEVWLAWTENPKDTLAKKLRSERRRAENALRMAVNHLALKGAAESADRVDSLVGFFGARAGSTEDAMESVKKIAGTAPRFFTPGEPPITVASVPGIRFWVLGPPRNEKLLKKSNPGKSEGYGLDAGEDGAQAFLVSALTRGLGMGMSDGSAFEDAIEEPFDPDYAIPMARATHLSFFEDRYFGPAGDSGLFERPEAGHESDEPRPWTNVAWRRIDSMWMDASETMALQLDSATNNTSLVLAIEIVDRKEVLLFPGDAQAGNWLSWQDLKWEIEEKGKKVTVTGPDLLARTIFYKVGHHGSHNATMKEKGLELMVHDDLVAMIPVNHEMAKKKGWGKMPLPDLVDRLEQKTHGRLLRIDDRATTREELAKLKPAIATREQWSEFTSRVKVTSLYYELSF